VVSSTPRPLYPRYLLDRSLGGPESRSGRSGEEKNSWRDSRPDANVLSDHYDFRLHGASSLKIGRVFQFLVALPLGGVIIQKIKVVLIAMSKQNMKGIRHNVAKQLFILIQQAFQTL